MTTKQTPFLIAISGGSGSGKTTLAQRLCVRLAPRSCVIIAEDRYYKDTRNVQGYDPKTYNFDDPAARDYDLLADHLNLLRVGKTITAPRYSLASHTRLSETDEIAPADVIIFEGIHILSNDKIRGLFDLTVYVDTPDDIRFLRRLVRDTKPEKDGGRDRTWQSVVEQYLGTVRPCHALFTEPAKTLADVVIHENHAGIENPDDAYLDGLLAPIFKKL